jgi:hypothetical protein
MSTDVAERREILVYKCAVIRKQRFTSKNIPNLLCMYLGSDDPVLLRNARAEPVFALQSHQIWGYYEIFQQATRNAQAGWANRSLFKAERFLGQRIETSSLRQAERMDDSQSKWSVETQFAAGNSFRGPTAVMDASPTDSTVGVAGQHARIGHNYVSCRMKPTNRWRGPWEAEKWRARSSPSRHTCSTFLEFAKLGGDFKGGGGEGDFSRANSVEYSRTPGSRTSHSCAASGTEPEQKKPFFCAASAGQTNEMSALLWK